MEKAGKTVSNISAEIVKKLRDQTGAGFMECKSALVETDGDLEKAVTVLRKRGQAAAQKKAERATSEGIVSAYIHAGGKIGVLIELSCETDYVARTDDFQALAKDMAMQVAAANPGWVRREDVPEEVLAQEKEILKSQAEQSGKPANVIDKIVEGRLNKFFAERVLLEQPFIKDADMTVQELITSKIAVLKENIQVRRFTRYERGESM
jgi:elongation factor Ts